MRLSAILLLLFLTVVGFLACQYSLEREISDSPYQVQTSIKSLEQAEEWIDFLAEEGIEHEWPSGTQIKIPANALIFSDGQIVNGAVSLKFRDYKDALDLLIAGYPVDHSQGMNKTAGAFKMEVRQGERKLFLDPTKYVFVKLASYEKEDDYSLFFWDEQAQELDSLLEEAPRMNEPHMALERSLRRIEPRIKFPLDNTYFTFNYKGILEVIYNNDFTNVSHPRTQKKMKEYGLRWSNFQVEEFIDFQGKREFAALMVWKNISRKTFPDWTKEGRGTLEQINKNRYRLLITDDTGNKKFSTQIEAIIPLEELFSLGPKYWQNDYDSKIEKVKATRVELSLMPSTYRSCEINRFGFYNWQKKYQEVESILLNAYFKRTNEETLSEGIYYLSGDRKGIVYYPEPVWDQLLFYDDPDAQIFSVSKDHSMWIFPNNNLRSIEIEQLKKLRTPSYIFKMQRVAALPKSKGELLQSLEVQS